MTGIFVLWFSAKNLNAAQSAAVKAVIGHTSGRYGALRITPPRNYCPFWLIVYYKLAKIAPKTAVFNIL